MIRAIASERNKQPILDVLKTLISRDTPLTALEVASGTGQHCVHICKHFTNITWQPTDIDPSCMTSIEKYIEAEGTTNVKAPLMLDVSQPVEQWPATIKGCLYDLIVNINMIHISPWVCTVGLFSSAGMLLKPSGLLITYGPYAVDGTLTPESNVLFDQSLRSRNAEWGVRDVADLRTLASQHRMQFVKAFDLPANNKVLVFKKHE